MLKPLSSSSGKSGASRYGSVPGSVGAINSKPPAVISMNRPQIGAFNPAFNPGNRIMGSDGRLETPQKRDTKSAGVVTGGSVNPLGKVGGSSLPTRDTPKPKPVILPPKPQPSYLPTGFTNVPQQQQQPLQQPKQTFAPSPTQSKPIKPLSNNPATSAYNASKSRMTPAAVSTPAPTIAPTGVSQQQITSLNNQVSEMKKEIEQLKALINDLNQGVEGVNERLNTSIWDSYSFEGTVSVDGGVDAWDELPFDNTDDNHIQNAKLPTNSPKLFSEGESVKLFYPLVEFNVTLGDGSLQKWRFARSRIFREEAYNISDVYFPLEISKAFLPKVDATSNVDDFTLVNTISNVRI